MAYLVSFKAETIPVLIVSLFFLVLFPGCGGGGGNSSQETGSGQPTLVSLSIAPQMLTVFSNHQQQFDAVATYSDGSIADVTNSVSWTSSSTATATISVSGIISSNMAGTTTISASSGSIASSTTLTVAASQTGFTLIDDTTDGRLFVFYDGAGGQAEYLGARADGLPSVLSTVRASLPDSATAEYRFDGQFRPIWMTTSDGSQFGVTWLSDTEGLLTGISSDLSTSITIPLDLQAGLLSKNGTHLDRTARAIPPTDGSSTVATVKVTSCNGQVLEDGALVYVARSSPLGGDFVRADSEGAGTGLYSKDLGSGTTVTNIEGMTGSDEDLFSNLCSVVGNGGLKFNPAYCTYLLNKKLIAGCTLLSGGIQVMNAACMVDKSEKFGILTTHSLINFLNSLHPSVGIIANATMNGVMLQKTLQGQNGLGSWPEIDIDFPCVSINSVVVTPQNSLLAVGLNEPLTATAYNSQSQVVESSGFSWTWAASPQTLLSIVPTQQPLNFLPSIASATGSRPGVANVAATEQKSHITGSAIVNVTGTVKTWFWLTTDDNGDDSQYSLTVNGVLVGQSPVGCGAEFAVELPLNQNISATVSLVAGHDNGFDLAGFGFNNAQPLPFLQDEWDFLYSEEYTLPFNLTAFTVGCNGGQDCPEPQYSNCH